MRLFSKQSLSLMALCGALALPQAAVAGTEEWDFSLFAYNNLGLRGNGPSATLTLGAEVEGTNPKLYVVQDYNGGEGKQMAFNGRFAIQDAGNQLFRSGSRTATLYDCVGIQAKAVRNFAILNLVAGDVVTLNVGAEQIKFVSTNAEVDGDGVEAGSWVTSDTEYVITEDGRLELTMNQWAYIYGITIESFSEVVSQPSFTLAGANGVTRTVTIKAGASTEGNAVTTYYTTDGSEPTAESASFEGASEDIVIGEGATEETSVTVRAITVSSEGTESEISTETFAVGTTLQLAPVNIVLTAIEQDGVTFHPVYKVTNDNSGIIGAPVASIEVTLNGVPVELDADGKLVATEAGTLIATATTEGYAASEGAVAIDECNYHLVQYIDFTAITGDDISEEPDGSNWSGAFVSGQQLRSYSLTDSKSTVVPGFTFNNMRLVTSLDGSVGYGIGVRSATNASIDFTLEEGQVAWFVTAKPANNPHIFHAYTTGEESAAIDNWNILSGVGIYAPGIQVTADENVAYTQVEGTASVKFTRTIAEGFNTIVLPFALTAAEVTEVLGEGTLYELTAASATTLDFATAAALEAHTPYLFNAAAAKVIDGVVIADRELTVATNGLIAAGTDYCLVGIYAPAAQDADDNPIVVGFDYVLGNDNAFHKATVKNAAKAFRAYIRPVEKDADVKTLGISLDGVLTAVERINGERVAAAAIYNVAGQRVAQPRKGINIIAGRKVVR